MQPTSSGSPIVFLVMLVFALAIYVFFSYCLKRIVEKCGEEPGAIIWVPVLQMLPLFRVAKLNPWLILLLFIPLANLIVAILLWVNILKVLGREPVMVLVVLFLEFIYIPYLALSWGKGTAPATA